MRCINCGGTMEHGTTQFCIPSATPPILVENVPALVCDTCGDETFDEATSQGLARVRNGQAQNFTSKVMRVFDFAKLDDPPVRSIGNSHYFTLLHDDSDIVAGDSTTARRTMILAAVGTAHAP